MSGFSKSVLVIGSGGREHALCWKLSQSNNVKNVYCLPGSPGIGEIEKVANVTEVNDKDFVGIVNWCKSNTIDLVVIGPEEPLSRGLADYLTNANIQCFGPGKEGAQIETNKDWSKAFMQRYDIPTARYESFTDRASATEFIKNAPFDALVVKASGLAAGKGVIVASDIAEACAAVDEILCEKKFGAAGDIVVIEEKLTGEEVSVLAFVDGNSVKVMLPAQDHKRLGKNDTGPNTGGMGAYCPCPLINNKNLDIVIEDVLQRAVDGLRKEGIKYCGVLYAGMMLTPNGPKTLEFNCRFGDPETQVILPLLDSDLYDVMIACCDGRLNGIELKFKNNVTAVGVIMASKGYPETSTKGSIITGIEEVVQKENHLIFHSAVGKSINNELITNGGRVLINVVLSRDLENAAKLATKACTIIKFNGAQYRTDIANKAFKPPQLSYKASGVDIDASEALVQRIKPLARGTDRPGVFGSLGDFSGLFRLKDIKYQNKSGDFVPYKDPVLVQGTDGVGTKLKIAKATGIYDTIGIDLVAMCVNDVLCSGAEPLAFLDYLACGKLHVPTAALIVKGISEGCRESNCALLGGETAEMPAIYSPGKYDLAGYCVGITEYNDVLPKINDICCGDIVIGLPSSGIHSNGYSLVNRIMDECKENFNNTAVFSKRKLTYGQEFLIPTRIYVKELLPVIRRGNIKALAHITGGGLSENIPRVLPKHLAVEIDGLSFDIPEVFGWLAAKGNIDNNEMLRTFNCGIGMIVIVSSANINTYKELSHYNAKIIGRVIDRNTANEQVIVNNFHTAISKIADKYNIDSLVKNSAISYKESGVDIIAGDSLVQKIKPMAKSTERPGVVGGLGGFGGIFRLNLLKRTNELGEDENYNDPILVMSTDGVGTKLKISQETNKHRTIGIDLVAMCSNDVLCNGAEPITFLDYFACGKLDVNVAADVVAGITDGCCQSECVLLGGETAEMPGMYDTGVYDLAGFSLGILNYNNMLPRLNDIKETDLLIGLPSSGVHSNGYSLIHKVIERAGVKYNDLASFSYGKTYGEEFLEPTKVYVQAVKSALKTGCIKAIAHITGGGLTENLPRILPNSLSAYIDSKLFHILPVFAWLAKMGQINNTEMLRTYNCGIGLIMIINKNDDQRVLASLAGHSPIVIGHLIKRNINHPHVIVQNFTSSIERSQRFLTKLNLQRVCVLISGNGSNLQSLIDATKASRSMGAEIKLVISNKSNAYGLERAKNANIPSVVIDHKNYKTREDYDTVISQELETYDIDLVCLAGFMRILSEEFVRKWKGRIINIHPALLPKYKGTHAQRQALEAGEEVSGCTVHFVDEGVDTGAIIVQEYVQIQPTDNEETLTKKINSIEHIAYPKALRLVATGAVILSPDGHTLWH